MRSMIAKTMVLVLGSTLCLSGMALASSPELVAAAKKEGKLRLITFPSFKKTAEGYEKKYGIKVEGTYVGAPGVLRKVSEESQAGIFAVDVFGTSPGPLSQLNNWTMKFKPAGYDKVAHHMKDLPKEWNQFPVFIHVVGASYHLDLISPDQAPTSIYDLLKPEYKGKIVSRVPWLGSNNLVHMISYWAWFGGSEEKWADYWSKFKANVGRFEPKWGQLHQAVGLKEYPLGIFTLPYTQFAFGRSYGNKLGYAPIKKEPAIWFPNLVTVHKNAPHPNAAKLFVEFAISPEGQQAFIDEGNIPAAKGLKPRASLAKQLEGVKLFPNSPQILSREVINNSAQWKERIQKVYQ